jgi:acyl-CoA thioesterase-1
MKYSILAVLALLLLLAGSGCREARKEVPAKEAEQAGGIIIALGDSLTAGQHVEAEDNYPAQLQRRLSAAGLHYQVINAGVSGETSSGALSRLNWILSQKPDIVILETGANDGLRGVDPALTRKNIEKIMAVLQEKKIITILAGMRMAVNMGIAYTDAFHRLYEDVAGETGAIFFPFFLEGVAGNPAFNTEDGIHPNAQGYAIITGNLYPYVLKAIALHTRTAEKSPR